MAATSELNRYIMFDVNTGPEWKQNFIDFPQSQKQRGGHDVYRYSVAGKVLNTASSQPYIHPLSNEVRNQSFKYANVTNTTIDYYFNIIPGMHPFQWDVWSLGVTVTAPGLGLIDGIIDNKDYDYKYRLFKDRLDEIDNTLWKKLMDKTSPAGGGGPGGGGPSGPGGPGGTGGAGGQGLSGISPIYNNITVQGSTQHQTVNNYATGGGENQTLRNRLTQPEFNSSYSFTFETDNFNPTDIVYGSISGKSNLYQETGKTKRNGSRSKRTKAADKWFEKALKDAELNSGENGVAYIYEGRGVLLTNGSSYKSKASKKRTEKREKPRPISSDPILKRIYDC